MTTTAASEQTSNNRQPGAARQSRHWSARESWTTGARATEGRRGRHPNAGAARGGDEARARGENENERNSLLLAVEVRWRRMAAAKSAKSCVGARTWRAFEESSVRRRQRGGAAWWSAAGGTGRRGQGERGRRHEREAWHESTHAG